MARYRRVNLVVYWGRWADARGGVGPFSATCATRVEGGAPCLLPETIRFPSMQRQALRGVWGESRKISVLPPRALPAPARTACVLAASTSESEAAGGGAQHVLEAAAVRMLMPARQESMPGALLNAASC
jgi:hypothetical protein